jgi:hypothetical protein
MDNAIVFILDRGLIGVHFLDEASNFSQTLKAHSRPAGERFLMTEA